MLLPYNITRLTVFLTDWEQQVKWHENTPPSPKQNRFLFLYQNSWPHQTCLSNFWSDKVLRRQTWSPSPSSTSRLDSQHRRFITSTCYTVVRYTCTCYTKPDVISNPAKELKIHLGGPWGHPPWKKGKYYCCILTGLSQEPYSFTMLGWFTRDSCRSCANTKDMILLMCIWGRM